MPRARALPVLLIVAASAAIPAAAPAAKTKADPTNVPAGVTAGGVDLSGLTLADAQARLDATIGVKVNADLVLGAGGKPWTLKAADAKLKFDSLTTAKRAIRAKTPGDVGLKLSHSKNAVKAWVAGVAAKVAKAPKDARVKITL